jgi:hypothetical protein
MELDDFFSERISKILKGINETTIEINELKDKLLDERLNYKKAIQSTSLKSSSINWEIFNSYLKCIHLEEQIENEKERLVYIYSSGMKLIIRSLDTEEFPYTIGTTIRRFVNNLYDNDCISENLHVLLPDLFSLEFVIESSENKILRHLTLQKIRFLQDIALKRRIR